MIKENKLQIPELKCCKLRLRNYIISITRLTESSFLLITNVSYSSSNFNKFTHSKNTICSQSKSKIDVF